MRPPARCVHVARVRVRVLGRAPRVRPRRPGDSPLEMGPRRRLPREVELGRSTSATNRRTGLGDSGSRSVYGWRGACPPTSRGSGSPVCLDLDFDLDLTSLGIFRGLAPGYKGFCSRGFWTGRRQHLQTLPVFCWMSPDLCRFLPAPSLTLHRTPKIRAFGKPICVLLFLETR